MPIQLRWLASSSTSAFHAAIAILEGHQLVDPQLQGFLQDPAGQLVEELLAAGLDPGAMFRLLAALSLGIENNRQLAQRALERLRGRHSGHEPTIGRIAGRIADLETAFRQANPDVVDELALRGEPLKTLFEARGPGLLAEVDRLVGEPIISAEADVGLVYPALGGHGVAHLQHNTVRIEAVLTNPEESLPEVIRLGWLLGQLQCDLPIYSESIAPESLARIAALALVPPTLLAAHGVELASDDPTTLRKALLAWRLVEDEPAAEALAPVLENWWLAFQDGPPGWRVALAALDRMLPMDERRQRELTVPPP